MDLIAAILVDMELEPPRVDDIKGKLHNMIKNRYVSCFKKKLK